MECIEDCMTQPPNSGAPQPVQGVTGGPPVLGGQIGNDPSSGNVVINPNPGNAVEIKKSPSAFNVYEYFNSNTDNSRLTLATALGGPDVMGIVSAPTSVNRDLQIVASGNGHVSIPALQFTFQQISVGTLVPITQNVFTLITGTTLTLVAGAYLLTAEIQFNTVAGAVYNVQIGGAATILQLLGSSIPTPT